MQNIFWTGWGLPVQAEFVLDKTLDRTLLESPRSNKLQLFYVRYTVEAGVL